jgi:hypothetical protein
LKRFSPLAVLIVAGVFVVAVDAAIMVVPNALADPALTAKPSIAASPDPVAEVVAASPTTFFDDPTWFPATSANAYVPTFTPAPATPTPVPDKATPAPTPRDTVWNARIYAKSRLGAKGYDCVNAIWTKESKWNPRAQNQYSGAYGIPQALPGSKMAAFGSNWRYSPLIQVKWGIWYVTSRYGSACAAYAFWQNNGWY